MPTIPKTQTLNASSVDILNAIRNSASTNYRDFVPKASNTAESIRRIGEIVMQYTPLQNEFLNALVNRIARVIITSKCTVIRFQCSKRVLLTLVKQSKKFS